MEQLVRDEDWGQGSEMQSEPLAELWGQMISFCIWSQGADSFGGMYPVRGNINYFLHEKEHAAERCKGGD